LTREEIIDLYNITFENRIIDESKGKTISKIMNVEDGSLWRFLFDWKSVAEIEEDLLPLFDVFDNEPDEEFETSGSMDFVYVQANTAKFRIMTNPFDLDNPDYEMPTEHFKIIIEMWRDFLLEPPLNGTKRKGHWNNSEIKSTYFPLLNGLTKVFKKK